MSDFVHLHTHTTFSPLDGVATPDEYFKVCAERKYKALAITEHGNMASIPDAFWAAQKHGVKYIPGCEIYYNNDEQERRTLEDAGTKVKELDDYNKFRLQRHRHITLLCKNIIGYRNLLKIREASYLNGFFRKPRASFDALSEHHNGLVMLSGCMNGPISFELGWYIERKKNGENCEVHLKNVLSLVKSFKRVFGEDFYIELQMPGVDGDDALFQWLVKIAKATKTPTVLTNDAHYITEEDYNVQRMMMAVDQKLTIDSPDLFISKSRSGYFKTREELRDTFIEGHTGVHIPYQNSETSIEDFDAACDNTLRIADKCESFNPDFGSKLPRIDNDDKILKDLTKESLKSRGLFNEEYTKRAAFELNRIIEKGFSSYFLICRDLVKYSTDVLKMPVGPRGSAGGSLVCYLIGIHDVDPVKHNLSFDRFLSSARGGNKLVVDMNSDEGA